MHFYLLQWIKGKVDQSIFQSTNPNRTIERNKKEWLWKKLKHRKNAVFLFTSKVPYLVVISNEDYYRKSEHPD